MTLSFTFAASVTPPLACDCQGAIVYVRLKIPYRSSTRDGHGVVRGQLNSRRQLSDGTWTYSIELDESGLAYPLPEIAGGMVESICCQGCHGYAAESFNMDEFGGRLVPADESLTAGLHFVRHTIRPFLVSDWRAWLDSPATSDVTAHLFVDGVQRTVNPLVIPAGETVSDSTFSFIDGRSYRIPEGSLVEIKIVDTGEGGGYYGTDPAALGFETWFFGHLNPSAYYSPVVALGTGPTNIVTSYAALENAPVGSEYHVYPYVYKKTNFGIIRISGDTSGWTPPA